LISRKHLADYENVPNIHKQNNVKLLIRKELIQCSREMFCSNADCFSFGGQKPGDIHSQLTTPPMMIAI
jgi:hypothetical protein